MIRTKDFSESALFMILPALLFLHQEKPAASFTLPAPGSSLVLRGFLDSSAHSNTLTWSVPDGLDINFVEVEYSPDGKNFHTAGLVLIIPHEDDRYLFRQLLSPDRPLTYYRLKQVNNNGTVAFSNVIRLRS